MKIKCLLIFLVFISVKANAQAPNYLWAKTVTDTLPSGAFGRGVATDANGNVFAAGYFTSYKMVFGADTLFSQGFEDAYLVKYDPLGNVLWCRRVGGVSEEHAYSVATDAAGNSYLAGHFYSPTMTVGAFTLTKVDMRDAFVVKFDPAGNVVWAKSGGGTNDEITNSVTVDPTGNVIIAGYFASPTVTFDGVTLTNSSANNDIFVVKYDPSGNLIWAKSNGGFAEEVARDVVADASGNIFVSGYFYSTSFSYGPSVLTNGGSSSYGDMFIAKYDPAGNVLWARSAGGTADEIAQSIDVDSSNNIVVAGSFRSPSITIGTTTLVNAGLSDIFLAKYDSLGNVMWAKRDGGAYDESPWGLSVDSEDNIALTGAWSGWSTTIAGMTHAVILGDEIFVAKYGASGNGLWSISTASSGTENAFAIDSDPDNNLVISGMMNASLSFGTITLMLPGSYHFYVAKLNNSKGLVWPGDANADHVVGNFDLLPVGLHYGQTGPARTIMGNVWQGDTATNWGALEANGADIKHADCNGDGVINDNDTLAINLNFNSTHAFEPAPEEYRVSNPALYFSSASLNYPPGAWINIDIMAGTAALPISSLYGLAFNINYDVAFVQPGTESILYPSSWLGTPGTDAIKTGLAAPLSAIAYGAETRTNHTNASGFGKIATFRFQAATAISTLTPINFSYSGYLANTATGSLVTLSRQTYTINIDPLATAIADQEALAELSVSPNPNNGNFNIFFNAPARSNYKLEIVNVMGQVVYTETLSDFSGTYSKPLSLGYNAKGVYTIRLTNDKNGEVKKIIVY